MELHLMHLLHPYKPSSLLSQPHTYSFPFALSPLQLCTFVASPIISQTLFYLEVYLFLAWYWLPDTASRTEYQQDLWHCFTFTCMFALLP